MSARPLSRLTMEPSGALPEIIEVGIELDRTGRACRIAILCKRPSAPAHEADLRAALVRTLSDSADVVEIDFLSLAAAGRLCSGVNYRDPLERAVLTAIVSITERTRLLQFADRCHAGRKREPSATAEDLVEEALCLLLCGRLTWHGSFERLLSTLCATIRNVAQTRARSARRRETLDAEPIPALGTAHDADREAVRVLLRSDVQAALGSLTDTQRPAVVSCWMEGERASAYASVTARPTSTIRVRLKRAKVPLRTALWPYRGSPEETALEHPR